MTRIVASFSISLDGYAAGPGISMDQPMGEGGERLHDWLFKSGSDIDAAAARAIRARTGAVILGRTTFELGLPHWRDTPFPVPSFVLTHEKRPALPMKSAAFAFVNDGLESALRQARSAANGKDVILMGVTTAQQFLAAGCVDELALQIVPVLLGAGVRLFDSIVGKPVELVPTSMANSPYVTHLTYAVPKRSA